MSNWKTYLKRQRVVQGHAYRSACEARARLRIGRPAPPVSPASSRLVLRAKGQGWGLRPVLASRCTPMDLAGTLQHGTVSRQKWGFSCLLARYHRTPSTAADAEASVGGDRETQTHHTSKSTEDEIERMANEGVDEEGARHEDG